MDNHIVKPILSVIIPCYNAGKYLAEALESVRSYNGKYSIETIVIDDGSTDEETVRLIKELAGKQNEIVIRQENKGPAGARNAGISISRGEYLLFLDSDNRIRSRYIDLGIEMLQQNAEIGIVYGKPFFFGAANQERFFKTGQFDLFRLLSHNYIDMCSVVRRQVWEDLGGLDENSLIIGHEDWDFWIRADNVGWKFHFIDEVLFDYRILDTSLVKSAVHPHRYSKMTEYLLCKHSEIYIDCYRKLYITSKWYKLDQKRPLRSFIKYFYNYFSRF